MGTEFTGHLNSTSLSLYEIKYILLGTRMYLHFGIKYIAGIRDWIQTGYCQTDRKLLNQCKI